MFNHACLRKGLFIREKVISVGEITFRQVYKRDLTLFRKQYKSYTAFISELKIEDADVKDDVRMASKWRGISIHGHMTPFSRRL